MMFGNSGSNQRASQTGFGGLSPFVKIAAAGIGLASESIREHKQRKNAKKMAAAEKLLNRNFKANKKNPIRLQCTVHLQFIATHRERYQGTEEKRALSEEEGDEEQWALDDAQDELLECQLVNPKSRPFAREPKQIAQLFIDDYPIPPGLRLRGRLNLPVVLPQRRPKDRSRGFIRAFAAELTSTNDQEEPHCP